MSTTLLLHMLQMSIIILSSRSSKKNKIKFNLLLKIQSKTAGDLVICGKSFIYKSTVIIKAYECVRSVLFGEAEPSLWYFIGAPVVCVVIWKVPRVR